MPPVFTKIAPRSLHIAYFQQEDIFSFFQNREIFANKPAMGRPCCEEFLRTLFLGGFYYPYSEFP